MAELMLRVESVAIMERRNQLTVTGTPQVSTRLGVMKKKFMNKELYKIRLNVESTKLKKRFAFYGDDLQKSFG
jgi:hypothetical protein